DAGRGTPLRQRSPAHPAVAESTGTAPSGPAHPPPAPARPAPADRVGITARAPAGRAAIRHPTGHVPTVAVRRGCSAVAASAEWWQRWRRGLTAETPARSAAYADPDSDVVAYSQCANRAGVQYGRNPPFPAPATPG